MTPLFTPVCLCVSISLSVLSPEPEHSLPVPEQAEESQLSVWGEQEGQPGEGVHRGAVQQGGGQGDLWEQPGDGKRWAAIPPRSTGDEGEETSSEGDWGVK